MAAQLKLVLLAIAMTLGVVTAAPASAQEASSLDNPSWCSVQVDVETSEAIVTFDYTTDVLVWNNGRIVSEVTAVVDNNGRGAARIALGSARTVQHFAVQSAHDDAPRTYCGFLEASPGTCTAAIVSNGSQEVLRLSFEHRDFVEVWLNGYVFFENNVVPRNPPDENGIATFDIELGNNLISAAPRQHFSIRSYFGVAGRTYCGSVPTQDIFDAASARGDSSIHPSSCSVSISADGSSAVVAYESPHADYQTKPWQNGVVVDGAGKVESSAGGEAVSIPLPGSGIGPSKSTVHYSVQARNATSSGRTYCGSIELQ